MSTDPRFKCSTCRKYKPSDEYGTRQLGGSNGRKGDRLTQCLSCSAANAAYRKRKRDETYIDHPVKRLATEALASPSQFIEALGKSASTANIDGSWRVSLDEVTLTDRDIANHIASLAWKATGYRFR
jgi:hypothetical protein